MYVLAWMVFGNLFLQITQTMRLGSIHYKSGSNTFALQNAPPKSTHYSYFPLILQIYNYEPNVKVRLINGLTVKSLTN